MVQITGKYQLVKSENFASHLVSMGMPLPQAKETENFKPVHEITLNGDKVSVVVKGERPIQMEFILNKEVDEKFPDFIVKTTATLEGDTLTLTSKHPNGKTEKKIHKFSDTELIVTFQDEDPATPDAVLVYRRL